MNKEILLEKINSILLRINNAKLEAELISLEDDIDMEDDELKLRILSNNLESILARYNYKE